MRKTWPFLAGLTFQASLAFGQGMKVEDYYYLTTKSNITMTEVLQKAGPPDLIREDMLGKRVRLYYIGEDQYSNRKSTTVLINGLTDRVISIERTQ